MRLHYASITVMQAVHRLRMITDRGSRVKFSRKEYADKFSIPLNASRLTRNISSLNHYGMTKKKWGSEGVITLSMFGTRLASMDSYPDVDDLRVAFLNVPLFREMYEYHKALDQIHVERILMKLYKVSRVAAADFYGSYAANLAECQLNADDEDDDILELLGVSPSKVSRFEWLRRRCLLMQKPGD